MFEPRGIQTESFPEDRRNAVDAAIKQHDQDAEVALDEQLEENSPYPGVVAAVRNTDEEVPANTVRAWVLGLLFVRTPRSLLCLPFLASFLLTSVDDDRISTQHDLFTKKPVNSNPFDCRTAFVLSGWVCMPPA